jgi:hypothetical protein
MSTHGFISGDSSLGNLISQPIINCQYFIETNLQALLSGGSSSFTASLEAGKEAVYKIEFYLNMITILPVNITDKNKIPQHMELFYNDILAQLKRLHNSIDDITFDALEYRLFFYFPEIISLQGFSTVGNKTRTALGKMLPVEVMEYCHPIKSALSTSSSWWGLK